MKAEIPSSAVEQAARRFGNGGFRRKSDRDGSEDYQADQESMERDEVKPFCEITADEKCRLC